MSSFDNLLARLVDLLVEDHEIREALIDLIEARAHAERELAAWRRRRK